MLGASRVEDISAEVAMRGVAIDCKQMPKGRDGYNEGRLHQVIKQLHPPITTCANSHDKSAAKTDSASPLCSARAAISNAVSLHAVHLRSDGGWMELTGGIDGEPLADNVSGSVGESGVSRWSSVASVGGEYEVVSFSVQPTQLDRPLASGERVVSASGEGRQ
jgi:hypothetical protein